MMKMIKTSVTATLLLVAALVTACKEKPAIASPACAGVDRITEPAQKADALKKCPRSGPDFKPSPPKTW